MFHSHKNIKYCYSYAMNIHVLSVDIYRVIGQYVSLKHLLITCKLIYYTIRTDLIYIKLHNTNSIKYIEDDSYCTRILSQIKSSSFQLSLNYIDITMTDNILQLFVQLHTLTLKSCINIVDVKCLGKIHTLTLNQCPGIVDVSGLGTVKVLSLEYCRNITDIKPLYKVPTLKIIKCLNIIDISSLCNVHTLTLCNIAVNLDPLGLGSVHSLSLHSIPNLVDLNFISRMYNISSINNISNISNIHTFVLYN